MKIDFEHRMSAHCENGVISNLLNHYGLSLSEPMIFGIGAGIYFTHLPMIKLHGMPVTSFRPLPGVIFRRTAKSLGIKMDVKRFKNKDEAMRELDKNLKAGIPTGMVVGVYDLTYFPTPYRFHFNAHNIIGIGKENGHYLISDPVMDNVQSISSEDLKVVRYARGTYKPRGKMYYITHVPDNIDLKRAVKRGIKRTVLEMYKLPGPIIGVEGMKFLSKRIRKWPNKLGKRKAAKYLGQIVRMQEEIGTGGAGFRFIYAAFLQEAAKLLENNIIDQASKDMTTIGDKWREFALDASRICKGRSTTKNYDTLADLLYEIALDEEKVYKNLNKAFSK